MSKLPPEFYKKIGAKGGKNRSKSPKAYYHFGELKKNDPKQLKEIQRKNSRQKSAL